MKRLILILLSGAVALLMALTVAPAQAKEKELFSIADDRISRSTGLVDLGDVMVTVNGGKGEGILFALDQSGQVVGTTTFGKVVNPTALAPAADGAVWVGDIGDPGGERDSVTVAKVPVGEGDQEVTPTTYELVYPDGPHDAGVLIADPDSDRLYVVTGARKDGLVFAAPEKLVEGEANRLEQIAKVPFVSTDGAAFPDGKHVLLRDYSMARVFSFPDFVEAGTIMLPGQAQGEGVSIGNGDRVRLSSQGIQQPVWEVSVPKKAFVLTATPTATPSPSAAGANDSPAAQPSTSAGGFADRWPLFVAILLGLAVIGAALWMLTSWRAERSRAARRRAEPRRRRAARTVSRPAPPPPPGQPEPPTDDLVVEPAPGVDAGERVDDSFVVPPPPASPATPIDSSFALPQASGNLAPPHPDEVFEMPLIPEPVVEPVLPPVPPTTRPGKRRAQ